MVSLRNYFTIVIVMCIIFCLFQASGVGSEMLNDYGENPYTEKLEELPGRNVRRLFWMAQILFLICRNFIEKFLLSWFIIWMILLPDNNPCILKSVSAEQNRRKNG